MKKGILALVAGIGLLVSNPSQAKDKDFYKVISSLKNCAYSSYKNQANPSRENASKERSACSKLDALKREKGISSLEDYFGGNGPGKYGWFYANSKEITDGKQIDSHYAAKIVKKFEKEGFPVYFTRLGNGVDSFGGFMYDMKYFGTINFPDGSKKIVIDLERIGEDAISVEEDWEGYKQNHGCLVNGDLENWKPKFESNYVSLIKYNHIRKGYINEKVNSILAHEFEHAIGDHRYNDINGEKIARSAEVGNSPMALYDIQESASKGKEAETAVFQCLMDTKKEDVFNKKKQAKFYLKGKKYIQQRANYCKKFFLRQRQNR